MYEYNNIINNSFTYFQFIMYFPSNEKIAEEQVLNQ